MPNITQLIQFEDAEIRIYDLNGERWVTAKELAAAANNRVDVSRSA